MEHLDIFETDSKFLGTNQSDMRALNEKLVLTLLRKHGALAKAQITKLTGLSAQTVSVIMRKLEEDLLLLRHEPIKGKVGQPIVPMSLNPEAVYFFGLNIGRRSAELIMIDFTGKIIKYEQIQHIYPNIDEILDFVRDKTTRFEKSLCTLQNPYRIGGIGIAMPFELWNWAEVIDLDPTLMEHWRNRDICAEINNFLDIPIFLENDATAACAAELTFGNSTLPANFLYIYIGFFIGGGVVLNNKVFTGSHGNSGAIGSLLVLNHNKDHVQLIETSSIAGLEKMLTLGGHNTDFLLRNQTNWTLPSDIKNTWVSRTAAGISQAILLANSVIDFDQIVIDSWISDDVKQEIVEEVEKDLENKHHSGITLPNVCLGTIGSKARVLGAASLPLFEQYIFVEP